MDVSHHALEVAARRLKLDRPSRAGQPAIELLHGSLLYADPRLKNLDALLLVEVIEHIDLDRLPFLEANLFGHLRPRVLVVTTPNREYNHHYAQLNDDKFRHTDHRFEWTRAEFHEWADDVATRRGYAWSWHGIGDPDEVSGTPTQMIVFERIAA